MTQSEELLRERFSALIRWERLKRREKFLVSALSFSLLASFIVLPAKEWFVVGVNSLSLPVIFFLILAPAFFLRHPWRNKDSERTVLRLDKTLRLQERAITAWEILSRKRGRTPELLVLEEAADKLRGIDPSTLFNRQYTWHALWAPPLLALWLFVYWLDIGVQLKETIRGLEFSPLVQKLREISHELKERAESHGLEKSLEVARALEKTAKKGLTGKAGERELREELSGMVQRIDEMASGQAGEVDARFSALTRERLWDLKAELDTLKQSFSALDSLMGKDRLDAEMAERLAALPRLREEMEKALSSIETEEGGLRRLLEQMERGVGGELDRRTLSEIKDILARLLDEAAGEQVETLVMGKNREDPLSEAPRVRQGGALPGDEPGKREGVPQSSSVPEGRAITHLKGLLGEGKTTALKFRGESAGKKSELPEDEVITSYRRQMEEELSSERIPQGLRESIKNYFLSLGMAEK